MMMREKQKHLDAFEYFYSLGGAASAENCRKVADKFQISERSFWNWYRDLEWKERVHILNIEVAKGVEKKTIATLIENKAKYLSYVHKLFDDWKLKVDSGEVPVEIKSVSDVDKIVKLALLLQDEATDKTETTHKGKIEAVLPDGIDEKVVEEFGLFLAKRGAIGSAENSSSEDDR